MTSSKFFVSIESLSHCMDRISLNADYTMFSRVFLSSLQTDKSNSRKTRTAITPAEMSSDKGSRTAITRGWQDPKPLKVRCSMSVHDVILSQTHKTNSANARHPAPGGAKYLAKTLASC